MIIGITGRSGAGKDVVGSFITSHGFSRLAFAGQVKHMCSVIFDLDMKYFCDPKLKDKMNMRYGKTPRQLMQTFATDFIRDKIDSNFWIHRIESFLDGDIVITDVRFDNELDMVKREGGIIIRVERNGGRDDDHISEIVPKYADYVISNNSDLDSLKMQVDRLMKKIVNKKRSTKV
jgi:hypothetical protein